MPYIKNEDRSEYNNIVEEVIREMNRKEILSGYAWKGHLNYFVTRLCHRIIQVRGLRYHNLNDLIGVLECIKQELYRRIASPYENKKIGENGTVSRLEDRLDPVEEE